MAVLNMTPTELAKILNDKSLRSQYQIVDVREDSELHVALKDKDVIHLPLSRSDVWAEEIVEGTSSLDKDMATVCVCHHGMRSKRVADFLGKTHDPLMPPVIVRRCADPSPHVTNVQ